LYRRLYRAQELDQVLFTIGLLFAMGAIVTLLVGPEPQQLVLPDTLQGQLDLGLLKYRTYSLLLIVVGSVIALLLWLAFERTIFGAQIRAAVDNGRIAGCQCRHAVHSQLCAG
jgi:branched-chain amino acid transport system permease protein